MKENVLPDQRSNSEVVGSDDSETQVGEIESDQIVHRQSPIARFMQERPMKLKKPQDSLKR